MFITLRTKMKVHS